MGTTQFDKIYHGLTAEVGKLRVASSGMAWKGAQSEGVVAIPAKDLKWAQWFRVARDFQLRLGLKDYSKEKFDGFLREDFEKLAKLLKEHFSITLETREGTFKGWNWGVTDFQGEDLVFAVSDKTSFELPLRQVANSNIAGRTEVSLEFNLAPRSGPSRPMGDELTEIRFFVPGTINKLKGSDAGSTKSDNEEDEEEISAAQVFHDTIKEKAEIGQVTGDLILSFEEALVLTPRGRYDMDMFKDFLRLRGKTYDYKVLYQSIARLFLLPKDDQHVLFILGLSTPIRQGQTLYQYLVMQFTREEEITAELNMSEEDIAKYDNLQKTYEQATWKVVSDVFRALAGKKVIGAGSFQSREGLPGFKANLKAIQGDLFMLERSIFFVSKSPLLIELSDIHTVVFSRVGSGASAGRTFDLKIVTKSGSEHNFTSINKEEHEVVEAYLKDKRVKVKNEMVPDADLLLAAVGDDDDDDEDMASVISDDDDSDSGGRKRKGKATSRPSNRADEDSEEEDEDFAASNSDSGSPSESDSDSSGAETASDASGDLALTSAAKKPKGKGKKGGADSKGKGKAKDDGKPAKKKVKKSGEGDASGAGSGSDEEGKAKSKPKAKPKPKEKAKPDSMDVDDEDKPKPKPKPKAATTGEGSSKPKPKPKPKPKADDAMDVDDEGSVSTKAKAKDAGDKPKPKPKPVPAKKKVEEVEEPPKKKMKKDD